MAPSRKLLFKYSKTSTADFAYGPNSRSAGAFRVVSVNQLLQFTPTIEVWEYSSIIWGKGGVHKTRLAGLNNGLKNMRYVAISHVWDYANDVDIDMKKSMIAAGKLTTFKVKTELQNGINYKPLSWEGLVQVAYAVKKLGAQWFWLDFLCLDQQDHPPPSGGKDMETMRLICMMSDIYENAWGVLCMVHGIPRVSDLNAHSAWIDRAWTLQEVVVNWRRTWIYFRAPNTWSPKGLPRGYIAWLVKGKHLQSLKLGTSLYIIKIADLLALADMGLSTSTLPRPYVLNGEARDTKNKRLNSDCPRRALQAAFSKNNYIKYTGVWRSMYMRTSTYAADVVYSIMGIFKLQIRPDGKTVDHLQIDPYRKNRTSMYIFNDLARKTAAVMNIGPGWFNIGPGWLAIGGVAGSDIPRSPESGIVFKFPHIEAAGQKGKNGPPKMRFGKRQEWVGYHVDDSCHFLFNFDIRFMTHSHPHLINANVLPVGNPWRVLTRTIPRPGGKGGTMRRYRVWCTIGSLEGEVLGSSRLSNARTKDIKAVVVGEVGDMTDYGVSIKKRRGEPTLKGYMYLLFIQYQPQEQKWELVADGSFRAKYGWNLPMGSRYRVIFTMGEKTPGNQPPMWPATSTSWFDQRKASARSVQASYGINPLQDWRVSPPDTRRLTWYGLRGYPSAQRGWKKFRVRVRISDLLGAKGESVKLDNALAQPLHLAVVSTSASAGQFPATSQTRTRWAVINEADMDVDLSYNAWTKSECADLLRAGVNGLHIPRPRTANWINYVYYWVQMAFGDQVMYVMMKPHPSTARAFWQVSVVPYSWGQGRGFENDGCIDIQAEFSGSMGAHGLGPSMTIAPGQPDADTAQRGWRSSKNWVRIQQELTAQGLPHTQENIRWWSRERLKRGYPGW